MCVCVCRIRSRILVLSRTGITQLELVHSSWGCASAKPTQQKHSDGGFAGRELGVALFSGLRERVFVGFPCAFASCT